MVGGLGVNSNIGVLLMYLYLVMAEICFMWLFLGRVAVLRMQMRSTVTDRDSVVCRSVCHTSVVSPAKTAEPIEMSFGLWARMGSINNY